MSTVTWRAPRVEELADQQPARLGRAAPVDVATVVARLVLAQRGKRGRSSRCPRSSTPRGRAAGPRRAGSRATVCGWTNSSVRSRPRRRAAHQPERVALDRRGGADLDDPAPRGRHDEELSCACPGASAGSTNRAADSPTGSSTRISSIGALASFVTAIGRWPAPDDDPTGLDLGVDPNLASDGEEEADREEDERRGGATMSSLGPPPPRADEPGREAEGEDRPAGAGPPTTAPRACRPTEAGARARRRPTQPRRVDPGRERAQRHTESAFVAGLLAKLASRHRLAHAEARSAGGRCRRGSGR